MRGKRRERKEESGQRKSEEEEEEEGEERNGKERQKEQERDTSPSVFAASPCTFMLWRWLLSLNLMNQPLLTLNFPSATSPPLSLQRVDLH